jgi:ferric-dicitrate binding protein FerR (iron transport regulator)
MDELDERLRHSDPLDPEWSPEPPDGPRARELLERIRNTPLVEETARPPAPARSRRRWWLVGAGAAAVVALGVGGVMLAADDDNGSEQAAVPSTAPSTPPAPTPAGSFQLPGADASMQMCLAVTEYVPDPAAQAFAGTVTAIDGTTVTLGVDRWYTDTGEQSDVVNLTGGTDVSVALDGVEFVVGQRYLVTAVNGEVQICGVSAPAAPDLEALYEQWYGS